MFHYVFEECCYNQLSSDVSLRFFAQSCPYGQEEQFYPTKEVKNSKKHACMSSLEFESHISIREFITSSLSNNGGGCAVPPISVLAHNGTWLSPTDYKDNAREGCICFTLPSSFRP